VNTALADLLGRDPSALHGRPVDEHAAPGESQGTEPFRRGTTVQLTRHFAQPDGRQVILVLSGSRAGSGDWVVHAVDVTARRRAESAQATAERLAEQRTGEQQTIGRLTAATLAARDEGDPPAAAAAAVAEALGVGRCSVILRAGVDRVRVVALAPETADKRRETVRFTGTLAERATEEGGALWVEGDGTPVPPERLRDSTSGACVVIGDPSAPGGWLEVFDRRSPPLGLEHLAFLTSAAGVLATAMGLRQAESDLAGAREALEREEFARRRAYEINDTVLQSLAVAGLWVRRGETERATAAIQSAMKGAQEVIDRLLTGDDAVGGPLQSGGLRREEAAQPLTPAPPPDGPDS